MENPFALVISSLLPEPQAGLLNGMLFGIRADLPPELYRDLIRTGTVHLIALSGTNISILIGLLHYVFLRFGKKISAYLTLFCIWSFIYGVGAAPSLVRAGIMGCLSILADVYGRQYWAFYSLFFSAGLMLMIDFSLISDISFQLSFLATLGVLLAQRRRVHSPTFFDTVIDHLRLTLYAQICTSPVLVFTFHQFSLIAPLANLLVAWVIQPVMVVGFVVVVAGWIWLPLGYIPAWVVYVPLSYIVWIVEALADIPGAEVRW